MTENIMRKECATIVTIRMEEQKNHGNVNIKNCTQTGCVRTVTLTNTIKWKEKRTVQIKELISKDMNPNNSTQNLKSKNHLEN